MSGAVVWLTGLPSSGKTTLARAIAERLHAAARPAALLDGDEVRAALVPPPGYDETARARFYATLGRLAALLARQGLIVLVAATAHRRIFRDAARAAVPRFVEVFVDTPAEECRRRDPKGLWSGGAGAALPGAGVAYEPPALPEVVAHGGEDAAAVERVLAFLA